VIALTEKAGRKAAALPGDLTDEGYARALPKRAADALGGLGSKPNQALEEK
jgi:hypothetical protein